MSKAIRYVTLVLVGVLLGWLLGNRHASEENTGTSPAPRGQMGQPSPEVAAVNPRGGLPIGSMTAWPKKPSNSKDSAPGKLQPAANGAPVKPAAELIQALIDKSDENAGGPFGPSIMARMHSQLLTEPSDPMWSPAAQSQLQSAISGIAGDNVEIVSVQCGGTVCEIQGASTTAEDSSEASRAWQEGVSSWHSQPWWSQSGFDQQASVLWSAPDGRTLVVTYVTRTGPDTPGAGSPPKLAPEDRKMSRDKATLAFNGD